MLTHHCVADKAVSISTAKGSRLLNFKTNPLPCNQQAHVWKLGTLLAVLRVLAMEQSQTAFVTEPVMALRTAALTLRVFVTQVRRGPYK